MLMNILAFVDTHEEPEKMARLKRIVEQESVDVAVCAGDFTIFGRKTRDMLGEISSLGVPVMVVHGNHEDPDEVVQEIQRYDNLHWIHGKSLDLFGVRFIGMGGHGFSRREEEFEAIEENLADEFNERTILVTHAPPFETALDEAMPEWHVGNASIRDCVLRRKPMLLLCGHIHQCFHRHDTLGKTKLINPGPDGELIEVRI